MRLCFLVLLVALSVHGTQDAKIIGGSVANISSYPFTVSLNYQGTHICGGSIISAGYILTAAHCLERINISKLVIHAGSKYIGYPRKRAFVTRVKLHENYNSNTSENDIALIELKSSLSFNKRILPIALPTENEDVLPNTTALILGWGRTSEQGESAPTLRKINVPIVDRTLCRQMYFPSIISNTMLCAGLIKGGKDSCQGDSGGPMVVNGKLTGIISWGHGCGRPGYPGVYTQVSKFRQWIKKNASI